MEHHNCCYDKCDRPGTIFIGLNRNSNCGWICASTATNGIAPDPVSLRTGFRAPWKNAERQGRIE
jgi:hypothetical protein